jgi:hypothetical protein
MEDSAPSQKCTLLQPTPEIFQLHVDERPKQPVTVNGHDV